MSGFIELLFFAVLTQAGFDCEMKFPVPPYAIDFRASKRRQPELFVEYTATGLIPQTRARRGVNPTFFS